VSLQETEEEKRPQERRPRDDRDRDLKDTATRNSWSHQKLERQGTDGPKEPSEAA